MLSATTHANTIDFIGDVHEWERSDVTGLLISEAEFLDSLDRENRLYFSMTDFENPEISFEDFDSRLSNFEFSGKMMWGINFGDGIPHGFERYDPPADCPDTPEPATAVLACAGLLALAVVLVKRKP